MELKVTLCKSTGLTPGNSCNSIDTIVNSIPFSDMIQVTGVAVKQTKGLSVVRLPLTFEQGIEVDYAIVGDVGYWVADIQYPNDNVGLVTLACDYFTTVGVDNIEIVGGWCTRRHVQKDDPFTNVLPEPFTPQEEFKLEIGGIVAKSGAAEVGSISVVVATVDLSVYDGGAPFAQAWQVEQGVDIDAKIGLFTPKINNLNDFTGYYMDIWTGEADLEYKYSTVPYTSIFRVDSEQAQFQIARMYSIGLDNVILDCYIIPGNYIDAINYAIGVPPWIPVLPNWVRSPDTLITSIGCKDVLIPSNIDPVFGDYKNAKVYSGQFQKIHLTSPSFGDDIEYTPEDITPIAGDTQILWRCCADLRFNGRPICYPHFYKNQVNFRYLEAVRGSEWMKSPVKQVGQSGYLTARISRNQEQALKIAGNALDRVMPDLELTSNLGKKAGVLAEAGLMATAETAGTLIGNYIRDNMGAGYIQANQPSIHFLQVPSLQNYIGNDFVDYRIRLSDGDMRRFDQFLTQYGYTVSEPLTRDCFFGRKNFNYVKAESVVVRLIGKSNLTFLNGVKEALQVGVRIWHKVPGVGDMDDNPILPNAKEAN